MESIKIKTTDGIGLAANYFKGKNSKGAIVYAHMMPATKESWTGLAEYLLADGFDGIAFDLRGHGASDGGPAGYRDFKPEDHRSSILDIKAAVDFLHSQKEGIADQKIILVGASIGANLSLQYLADNAQFKNAVLFSPGLNYHGLEALPLIHKLHEGQKVFYIASHDDMAGGSDNAKQNELMYNETPVVVTKKIKLYTAGGHGTFLIENNPAITKDILEFIS